VSLSKYDIIVYIYISILTLVILLVVLHVTIIHILILLLLIVVLLSGSLVLSRFTARRDLQLFTHELDIAILFKDLVLDARDLAVLLEFFILELLFEGVLVLVGVVRKSLRITSGDSIVLATISLLQGRRHDLVSDHFGIEDAIKRPILRSLAINSLVLVHNGDVVVLKTTEHLFEALNHRCLVLDEGHDVTTQLLLHIVQVGVHKVDNAGRRHLDFKNLLLSDDLTDSGSFHFDISHEKISLIDISESTDVDDLLYVREVHILAAKFLVHIEEDVMSLIASIFESL